MFVLVLSLWKEIETKWKVAPLWRVARQKGTRTYATPVTLISESLRVLFSYFQHRSKWQQRTISLLVLLLR